MSWSSRKRLLVVNGILIGILAVLGYVIFVMDRSPDLSEGPRIDLQELLSKRRPVLLEFGKGWCRPCKYMKPILEDTAGAYKGRLDRFCLTRRTISANI